MGNVFLWVIDGFGVGEAPDAAEYGDIGANTLTSIAKDLKIPNLLRLGFGGIDGVDCFDNPTVMRSTVGRLRELSAGKDTITGHFEIAGILTKAPFPTYPHGFPPEVILRLEEAFGKEVLGNIAASGTEIIERLGEEHLRTGKPIVYTSADSVLQIACHDSLYSVEELYTLCKKARALMQGEDRVARIIARPFTGTAGSFKRTAMRKDFGIEPPKPNLLSLLEEMQISVIAVGKIYDIFAGQGFVERCETHSNQEGFDAIFTLLQKKLQSTLVFANFVDTDMLFGHRRDIAGYRACIEEFDRFLGDFLKQMPAEDILMITSDHGCDPGAPGSDHTREYVPLLIYQKDKVGSNLGTIDGFDWITRYIIDHFHAK